MMGIVLAASICNYSIVYTTLTFFVYFKAEKMFYFYWFRTRLTGHALEDELKRRRATVTAICLMSDFINRVLQWINCLNTIFLYKNICVQPGNLLLNREELYNSHSKNDHIFDKMFDKVCISHTHDRDSFISFPKQFLYRIKGHVHFCIYTPPSRVSSDKLKEEYDCISCNAHQILLESWWWFRMMKLLHKDK